MATGLRTVREAGGRIIRTYERETAQTCNVIAPVNFYEDFINTAATFPAAASPEFGGLWTVRDTANETEAYGADAANGNVLLTLTSANEAQAAVLDQNNQHNFVVASGKYTNMEFRATVTSADMTGIILCMGLADDYNATADTVAKSIWFRLDGSLALKAEWDDGTNTQDDIDCGTTIVTAVPHVYRIDASDLSSIKFYVDGVKVADSAGYTATAFNDDVSPVFRVQKASGTTLAVLAVDYVRVWGVR